jgi:hypothetical protein
MRSFLISAGIAISTLAASSAFAETYSFDIHSCRAVDPSQASMFGTCRSLYNNRDVTGVGNYSTTTSVTIECPLPISYNAASVPTMSYPYVSWWNLMGSSATCTLYRMSENGNANAALEQWSVTSHVTTGPNSLDYFSAFTSADGWWKLRCTLPPKASAGMSVILTGIHMYSLN